ncbi:hypothetical protein N2152v2_005134 [Parachlorella kessleri]
MRTSVVLALVALAATFATGRASLTSTAQSAGLTSLVAAVQYAGLTSTLDNLKAGTILAPDNEAFDNLLTTLNATRLTQLNKALVAEVLQYHVLPTSTKSTAFKNDEELKPLGPKGSTLAVSVSGKTVIFEPSSGVSPATIIKADVPVSNTTVLVDVIDEVLVPIEVAELVGLA